jgi:hypothetical protein
MKFRAPVAAAIAIAFGLVVLLGYFIPADMGASSLSNLLVLRSWIIGWAVTLAGFATLVAIVGLVSAHWRKLRARRNPDRYSLFMLAAFVLVFVFGVMQYLGGDVTTFQQIVNAIQVPVEASMMAILAVTLTMAAIGLFRRRKGLLPVVFLISVLVFLLLNSGLLASQENIPFVGDILAMLQYLPVAGARGILIGIALGSLMAGLRILFGTARPYSG